MTVSLIGLKASADKLNARLQADGFLSPDEGATALALCYEFIRMHEAEQVMGGVHGEDGGLISACSNKGDNLAPPANKQAELVSIAGEDANKPSEMLDNEVLSAIKDAVSKARKDFAAEPDDFNGSLDDDDLVAYIFPRIYKYIGLPKREIVEEEAPQRLLNIAALEKATVEYYNSDRPADTDDVAVLKLCKSFLCKYHAAIAGQKIWPSAEQKNPAEAINSAIAALNAWRDAVQTRGFITVAQAWVSQGEAALAALSEIEGGS